MKLRNLFLAGLAVCTMASCSNDDDVNNGPIAEVDASLAFVATSDGLQTKADDTQAGTTKEDFINKLDVYIFKADGTLANKKTVNAENGQSVTQVDHILLKVTPGATLDAATTNAFTAYFLANCDNITATTLATFEAAVAAKNVNSFGYEATTNYKYLPMAKKVEFSGLRPLVNSQGKYVENWVQNNGTAIAGTAVDKDLHDASVSAPATGYSQIVVERLVARIQVEKIEVDLSAINSTSSFKLTNLALANVHTDVTPTGAVYTKKLWAKGYQGPEYTSKDAVVAPYAAAAPYNAAVASLAKAYSYQSALTSYDFNAVGADKFISYVYPNAGDDTFEYTKNQSTVDGTSKAEATGHTLLLIAGEYKATSASTPVVKHFRVKIDHDPTAAVENKVVANYIYKLTVKITGEGSENEDDYELNAHVAATISVAKWNVVEQTEEDAN